MKIKIYLKDPDALHDAINQAVDGLEIPGLNEGEATSVREIRKEDYGNIARKWFEYGECLTLEMDTTEKTLIVLQKL